MCNFYRNTPNSILSAHETAGQSGFTQQFLNTWKLPPESFNLFPVLAFFEGKTPVQTYDFLAAIIHGDPLPEQLKYVSANRAEIISLTMALVAASPNHAAYFDARALAPAGDAS